MKFISDLHIHSKYSRATSSEMNIKNISKWAKIKGVKLMGTGDFTHPLWLNEIKTYLKEYENGIYECDDTFFIIQTEVSNIFQRDGVTKKIHNIIFSPNIETAEKINKRLEKYGNLLADGRPILSLDTTDLVKILMDISTDVFIVPAHAWTPHFSLFGSNSGFDSVEDCFKEYSKYIYSLETGLSSDPPMNWRLSSLDKFTLTSNSDAHSPNKIAREANVFDCKLDYYEIINALKNKDRKKILFTIEFYPQEGKYHYDGHRNCELRLHPKETKRLNYTCPVCGKRLTIGVLNRVEELADRPEGFICDTINYKNLIPLEEIIADVLNTNTNSQKVKDEYFKLVNYFGSEFNVLLYSEYNELEKVTSPETAMAIIKSRIGEVEIQPGYDGVYGKISIKKEEKKETTIEGQLQLF